MKISLILLVTPFVFSTNPKIVKKKQNNIPCASSDIQEIHETDGFPVMTPERFWANTYLKEFIIPTLKSNIQAPIRREIRSGRPIINDQFDNLETTVKLFKKQLEQNLGNNLQFHELHDNFDMNPVGYKPKVMNKIADEPVFPPAFWTFQREFNPRFENTILKKIENLNSEIEKLL